MSVVFYCQNCENNFSAPTSVGFETGVFCPNCDCDILGILKEEVNSIIQTGSVNAIKRAGRIPPLPKKTNILLRGEWENVRKSYILAQYSASLMLGTSFLEYLLNEALLNKEPMMLHNCIRKCEKNQIIDNKTASALLAIKEFIRNRYAHGNAKDIAGNASLKITMINTRGGVITSQTTADSTVNQFPFFQIRQKHKHDRMFSEATLSVIWKTACNVIEKNNHLCI